MMFKNVIARSETTKQSRKNGSPRLLRALAMTLLLCALLPVPAKAQDITTGLVGHWTLDETSGTTANDSTAGNNDGTMQGGLNGVNNSVAGKISRALDFDGIDDNIVDTNFPFQPVPFSFSVWFNPQAASTTTKSAFVLISQDRNFYIRWDSDFGPQEVLGFVSGGSAVNASIGTVTPGKWHHIVGTYDGTTLRAYNNGVEVDSTASTLTPDDDSDTFVIGNEFEGFVDDPRLYNRALSAEDVAALYRARAPGTIKYNADWRVPEYFDGARWIAMGPTKTISDGLVAHWKLEETSSPSLSETGSFDMTWQGSPSSVSGYEGDALNFNANNEFLSTPSDPGLEGFDEITISAWIYPTGVSGANWGRIVSKTDGGTSDDYALILTNSNYATFRVNTGGGETEIGSFVALPSNTRWYHVVGTVDSTGTMILYLDGFVQQAVNGVTGPIADSNLPLSIGRHYDTNTRNFTGYIDDVRIYNRALTSAEVYILHELHEISSDPVNLDSGLISHWRMEETTGTAVADETGANNGTFTGAASVASVAGYIGNALEFDGSDDRLEVGDFDVNGTGITLASWVYAQSHPNDSRIIAKASSGSTQGAHDWALIVVSSNREVRLRLRTVNGVEDVDSGYILPLNEWHHLAAIYDESDDLVRFYVDGSFVSSVEHASGGAIVTGSGSDVTIGNMPGSATDNVRPWDGYLDEVRVYDRPLNSAEIKALARKRCATPDRFEGTIVYNADEDVMQFCDGEDWIAMGPVPGAGGGGCTGPVGTAGNILYASDHRYMQYCDGSDWIQIGGRGIPTNGLIGYWPFEDGTGSTTAEDIIGTADGTLTNMDANTDWVAGIMGGGLDLDGADDIVNFGDYTGLEGVTAFTVSIWVRNHKPELIATGNERLIDKVGAGNDTLQFTLQQSEDMHFSIQTNAGAGNDLVAEYTDGISPGNADEWHHVVGVYNGVDIRLYINGILGDVVIPHNQATNNTAHNFLIGTDDSANGGWDGVVDELRIYSRALSASEITDLYYGTGGN